MTERCRLLVLSHVLPFPGNAGQQQRVYYKLLALRRHFDITFVTFARQDRSAAIRDQLLTLCDDAVVLPSSYSTTLAAKVVHRLLGTLYMLSTGLKLSNYLIGQLEFSPARINDVLEERGSDLALYEYWHAIDSVRVVQEYGVPCVLDMHNVLWQSYTRQLAARHYWPQQWKQWAIARYRRQEEDAWRRFDALIAINSGEQQYARSVVPNRTPVFYAPMGTDLTKWPYSWLPAQPPRIAYYGGLGSSHNQRDAMLCYEKIMPAIWEQHPDVEFWVVGSNPPERLRSLPSTDERVTVTGYVEEVQAVLRTMSVVLCPWSGTYGFRSRLIEVMALGIPVVASPEAVYGMRMDAGKGLFLEEQPEKMASVCLALLQDCELASQQSSLARRQVEEKYGFEATYGRLAEDLLDFARRTQVNSGQISRSFRAGNCQRSPVS